jgi:hypothetical protein
MVVSRRMAAEISKLKKKEEEEEGYSLALRHSGQTDMILFSSSIESRIHV